MKKNVLLINFLLLCFIHLKTTAQITELPLSMKVENATIIFEGKVLSKTSFWNPEHTLIVTSNKIEVYKVFKGDINSDTVQIITEGGTVGYDMQDASESLRLSEGLIGMFFTKLSGLKDPKAIDIPALVIYGGVQGFVKYNVPENTASDSFKTYVNIQQQLYEPIKLQIGQEVKIIGSPSSNNVTETTAKKKCFWCRIFGCKHKK